MGHETNLKNHPSNRPDIHRRPGLLGPNLVFGFLVFSLDSDYLFKNIRNEFRVGTLDSWISYLSIELFANQDSVTR